MKRGRQTAYVTGIPIRQFADIGNMCAWDGCRETFKGHRMPYGWRSLLLFWSPSLGLANMLELLQPPAIWDRDCVLCPKHADHLHNLVLKDIGQRLNKTEGSA